MNWLAVRLSDSSPEQHFEVWGHFRSFGRTTFIRGGVGQWAAATAGAGAFVNLLYNFAQSGEWRFGWFWVPFAVLCAVASFVVYRRAWEANERAYFAHRRIGAA